MYEKEAKQQEEKIEKMKAEACDDYGIKKQVNYPKTCKIILCFYLIIVILKQKNSCTSFGLLQTKILSIAKVTICICEKFLPSRTLNYKETGYRLFTTWYQMAITNNEYQDIVNSHSQKYCHPENKCFGCV